MIGIIDYGMGNLHSVANACDHLGLETLISSDPAKLAACDKLIFPGVGSIADCMKNLQEAGLDTFILKAVNEKKTPILGICLGMQALFESSQENGGVTCLGLLPGKVIALTDPAVRIPHIGWNQLEYTQEQPDHPVYVYFDHSYYASDMDPEDLIAYARHGRHIVPAIVGHDHILGCQFHPEKSAQDGLAILEAFGKGTL